MSSGQNFQGADLSGQDFSAKVLPGVNFRGAKLNGADFSFAQLPGADFTDADLQGAIFFNQELNRQLQHESKKEPLLNLEGANLSGANLQGASFWGVNLNDARLVKANLEGADFNAHDVFFPGTLQRANLTGANGKKAHFSSINMDSATLKGGDFTEADFSGSDMTSVNADGAIFRRATMRSIDAYHSSFRKADLSHANLSNLDSMSPLTGKMRGYLFAAHLDGASLEGADLSGMWTIRTKYRNANLRNTIFKGTQVQLAEFDGADLTGAKFFPAGQYNLAKIKSVSRHDQTTQWTTQEGGKCMAVLLIGVLGAGSAISMVYHWISS